MRTDLLRASRRVLFVIVVLAGVVVALRGAGASVQAPVDLGTAGASAVLAGQAVTNTGPSVINGDLGVSPGSAVTGFPPGIVNGTVHAADAVAGQAQADLTVAYNDAAGRAPDVNLTGQDLGGLTLTPGVYTFDTASQLTGALTLDAQGDGAAVFIFQIGSTLTTATDSTVLPINGAQACNVFWKVGSSATLGTTTTFVGNILALTSITAVTGTTVDGRLLAREGAVTLDTNVVTRATCAPVPPATTTVAPVGVGPATRSAPVGVGPAASAAPVGTGRTAAQLGSTTTTTEVPSTTMTTAGGDRGTGGVTTSPQTDTGRAATPGSISERPSSGLARTGGGSLLPAFALGLLLLVAGALALQVAGAEPASEIAQRGTSRGRGRGR